MIPHIIQERSIKQDIHHPGEIAQYAPIDCGEEAQRGDRPVSGWMINLYSSTKRRRESKDPRPVTSANLDHCGSRDRVPSQISAWTPAL